VRPAQKIQGLALEGVMGSGASDRWWKALEVGSVSGCLSTISGILSCWRRPPNGSKTPRFYTWSRSIYLNEVDWYFEAIRRTTAEGPFEAVNYHRFADDIVITVSGNSRKHGWAERALHRLQEKLEPLGVELNREKTQVVDTLKGEAFEFLGFDLRRVPKRRGRRLFYSHDAEEEGPQGHQGQDPRHHPPRRDHPRQGAGGTDQRRAGWVNYFRVGNSSRAFSEVRDYLEMKIRTLLTRRQRRQKRSVGWRRWNNEYLYDALGLFWDWKIHPLSSSEAYS